MGQYESIKDINFSSGFDEVLYYANNVTNSWISRMLLIGIFILVSFGVYKYKDDLLEALSIGGLTTFFIALLFWNAGFIDGLTLLINIVFTIVFFGLLWFTKKSP